MSWLIDVVIYYFFIFSSGEGSSVQHGGELKQVRLILWFYGFNVISNDCRGLPNPLSKPCDHTVSTLSGIKWKPLFFVSIPFD